MASIQARQSKRDNRTYYRVRWQTGGRRSGDWDGESFDAYAEAKRFKGLVDACGNRRPSYQQLIDHGLGYLITGGSGDPEQVTSPSAEPPAPRPSGDPATEPGTRPARPATTFQEYARDYLDRLTRPNRETKRKYLERLTNHVYPTLGQRPIADITRREIRLWQQALAERLSPKTIANIRGETLVPIFEAACRPGEDDEPPLRSYNPAKGLPLPEYVRPDRDIVETAHEARTLIEAAHTIDPHAADLLVTMLATGLRWGEIAGLPARAIHPDRGTISIVQVVRREYGTWIVVAKPKTRTGYRQVPVPAQIMTILRRRCHGRPRTAFVFTDPTSGDFWRYTRFYHAAWLKIRALAERHGLDKHLTPHGLRHSLLTLLATEGVDLEALRQIAGHKRIATTYDLYVHTTGKHHEPVRTIVTGFVGDALPEATGNRHQPASNTATNHVGDAPPEAN